MIELQIVKPILRYKSVYKMMKSRMIFLAFPLAIFFQGCIPYIYHVGKEQVRIVFKKEKIEKALPKIQDEFTKQKLNFVEEARIFAINRLYLNPKGGFQYYFSLDREEIGWNVSASYPLKFESYEWWFPIVGKVPYKGFFDLEKVKEEEKHLIEKGFDTRIRAIGGYSTLGWFSDPIFSCQLKTDEFHLAGLVFHEMAHATIYINGDGVFNESYASFIEEEGIKEFFIIRNQVNELQKRELKRQQNMVVSDLIKKTANELKELYEKNIPDAEKLGNKSLIISRFKENILLKVRFSPEERNRFIEKKLNNEDFIGYQRYNSGGKFFQETFIRVGRDFKKFHEEMQKLRILTNEERTFLLNKK